MASIDKNQAVIDYLLTMSYLHDNPLFFNFINAADNNKQYVTMSDDKSLDVEYIDGSVLKRYTFTLIDYKSVNYNPIVNSVQDYTDENMDEYLDVQSIIDWVTEQNDNYNFPNFGEDCRVESIEALSNQPNLNGVDVSLTPQLAKYSISIRITYLDISKVIYR